MQRVTSCVWQLPSVDVARVALRDLQRLDIGGGLFRRPSAGTLDDGVQGRVDIPGHPASIAAGQVSQQRAMTLLKNENHLLPLQGRPKIFVKNIEPATAAQYADVVGTPEEADFAILRLDTPWIPFETSNLFARDFHHGDLDFKAEAKAEILALLQAVPTIVVLYLDRPAVIPEISAAAGALLGEYGASDTAVLEVVFGKARPEGKLPFGLSRWLFCGHALCSVLMIFWRYLLVGTTGLHRLLRLT